MSTAHARAMALSTSANSSDVVKATVACANATGGATDAALTVTLTKDNGDALDTAKQVHLCSNTSQYTFGPSGSANSSLTLGTVTKGSIVATPSAGVCWLIQTDDAGEFACTATNTDDETVYFFVASPSSVSVAGKGCIVIESTNDGATWSA